MFTATQAVFGLSIGLTFVEMVYFYCKKVRGEHSEVSEKTGKPRVNKRGVRCLGFCSVVLTVLAIALGVTQFEDQGCLERWFVDKERNCKSCTLYFGEECLGCASSAKCDTCKPGYFFASQNDTQRGIVAETEIRCRPCAEFFGEFCLECTQTQCTVSAQKSAFLDAKGLVIECSSIPNCAPDSCDAKGCTACNAGFYLDANRQCQACGGAIPNCKTCSSATVCTSCAFNYLKVSEKKERCECDPSQVPNSILNPQTGFCECLKAGEFMHANHGCLQCDYLVPGCSSCSQVAWNSGISLDTGRLAGPQGAAVYLSCNKCTTNDRFVKITLNPKIAVEGFNYAAPTFAALPP